MPTFKDHIPVLDSLRGLAAVLVVFTHIPHGVLGSTYREVQGFLRPGYVAIEIFFVLSGFLITRILLHDREHGKPLRHFLVRRFLRIFPIYYLFLALMLFWHPWEEIRWCALYVSNFVYPFENPHSHLRHTWSLCVEEHYYLLWAFAVYALSYRMSRWIARWGFLLLAVVSAWITLDVLVPGEAKRMLYMGSCYRMVSLALGSAIAFAEPTIRTKPRHAVLVAIALFLVGEVFVQLFVVGLISQHPSVGIKTYLSWTWVPMVRLLAFPLVSGGVVLGCVGAAMAGWTRILRWPSPLALIDHALQFVGRISYGWYLFHVPLFAAVFKWQGETLGALGLAAGLSLVAATLSYYAIERPILKLKHRFT